MADPFYVGLLHVSCVYCDYYMTSPAFLEPSEPLEIPDHMNPTIYNQVSRFGHVKPTEFLNLPHEVRLLIYAHLLHPTVYSNNVKGLRYKHLGRHYYKSGETRIVPTSLSLLLTSRLINIEATYFLYRNSGCTFRLYIGAVGIAEQYSAPLSTQRTMSLVQKLEIDINIKDYAHLPSSTLTKWRTQLENFSSGSRECCRITLSGKSLFSVFPKGLIRLLKLLCGFRIVEIVLGKDREEYGLDQLKTLVGDLKGVMGVGKLEGKWPGAKRMDRLVFHLPQG
jgi:hypothetical protein